MDLPFAEASDMKTPVAQVVSNDDVIQAEVLPSLETTDEMDEAQLQSIASHLHATQGIPPGLAKTIALDAHDAFAERIWVVDNSGSMSNNDGHKVVLRSGSSSKGAIVNTTRWDELGETLKAQSQLAATLRALTTFRLLNPVPRVPQHVIVGASNGDTDHELSVVSKIVKSSPRGPTPLTSHVNQIREYIASRADELRAAGKQIVVVIATDGLPSAEAGRRSADAKTDFISALQSLHGLPVHLVVRLCTDEEDVGEFWNDMDGILELPLDVLDDYLGEAEEIHRVNPWLNYGMALHMAREFGVVHKVFDLLDERPLSAVEIKEFLFLMFGWENIPEPSLDWSEFQSFVQTRLRAQGDVWNPVKRQAGPWVDVRELRKLLSSGSSCSLS